MKTKDFVAADLIKKLQTLEGLTNDERSNLIGLLRQHKKYGLVWEDKPEDVEERLRDSLPVLREVKEKAIIGTPLRGGDGGGLPNHILIEGDNLEALTALSYTHEGKIDVIYIDPPYNTGNNDFVYNDSFVDSEDDYRHSKWLSFMNKRLKIAKNLLSDKGVIFISIDDNELVNLKMLLDEIFCSFNYIAVLPTIMNLKGNQDEFGFAGTHEYTIVYAKSKSYCCLGQLEIDDEEMDEWEEDQIGFFKKGATLKRTGADAPRERRPYGYFPILVDNTTNSVSCVEENEYKKIYDPINHSFDDEHVRTLISKYSSRGYSVLLPFIGNNPASWRWGYNKVRNEHSEIIVIGENNAYSLYKKQRPELGDLPSKKPKSVFYKAQYSSGNGTSQLKDVGLERKFNNPKPLDLIGDFLKIGASRESLILDFFAGSGTTLHATMQLNAKDNGHRQCILVTNNENNICEEVTYERNKRVIQGYTTPKGVKAEGLKQNTLRYYKTDFIPRDRTQKNMRALVAAATDLLCIKEDLYEEQQTFGRFTLKPHLVRYFNDGRKHMLIIYREELIDEIVEEIKCLPLTPSKGEGNLKIYVFSPGRYAFTDNFREVEDKVELVALPAAIYDAYQKVLPKRKEKLFEEEKQETEFPSDLFEGQEEGGEA